MRLIYVLGTMTTTSTYKNLVDTAVGIGAVILNAADKFLYAQAIIFGLNNIILESFSTRLGAMNIIVGTKIILRSTCASW